MKEVSGSFCTAVYSIYLNHYSQNELNYVDKE